MGLQLTRRFIFAVGVLNVSHDAAKHMDQPSVKFKDGSGHFYVMDVFHQLHCLNYLRKKTVLYSHLYPFEINDPEVPPEFHIRKYFHSGNYRYP